MQRISLGRYYIGRIEQNPLAEDMHQAVNYLGQELYSRTRWPRTCTRR
jgi:sacsin